MPRRSDGTPAYRRQVKANGKALGFAEFREAGCAAPVRIYFRGEFKSKESRAEYARLIAKWETNGRRLPVSVLGVSPDTCKTKTLVAEHLADIRRWYPEGSKGTEVQNFEFATAPWLELYREEPVAAFSPEDFEAVRERMVAAGLSRTTINARCRRVRSVLRWGVAKRLVHPDVLAAIQAVAPLKRGRTTAKEPEKVRPVEDDAIEATLPHLPRPVRGIVELQRLTGARAGELLGLKAEHIDRTGPVWVITLDSHKTAHRGRERHLYVGPRGQQILSPFLLRAAAGEYLFRPADAFAERSEQAASHRREDQRPTPRKTTRTIRPKYDTASYRRCIKRAAKAAKVAPWSPHRLRHSAATRIAREFGLEVAKAVLGHSKVETTQIYTERDAKAAAAVAEKIG